MKNISRLLATVCCSSILLLPGCIEETIPTNTATSEQLGSSAKATEALLWGMPAFLNKHNAMGRDAHYDWGYGSLMHIRDVQTGDMAIAYSGYDQYSYWERNSYMGEGYIFAQFMWTYFWKFVQTSNNLIGAVSEETASELQLGYLGVGHAFRALAYLDLARSYEFLPNDKFTTNSAGKDITNLTVPIVTETTTEEEARNNPRVSRQQMFDFILADLDKAEQYIGKMQRPSKTLPDLVAVYGLKARLYMWVEDYANAKIYARKAIDQGGYTPVTASEWLNPTTGFNDLNCNAWIWGAKTQKEDDVVQTGIVNWTSWASNEAVYGYSAAGPMSMVSASMYDRISDDDFRKLSWKAPAGSALDGQNIYLDEWWGTQLPTYASLKFRPNEGEMEDYNVGSSSAYPLMRIEEMYFIEAEAAAHLNASEGKQLVEDFMKTYRYDSYVCNVSSTEDVVDEIVFQKRVELWGEGQAFFDIKRLNMPVIRKYENTNFREDAQFNTTSRPAWMNYCIVRGEKNNNEALVDYENPDPSDCYK